MPGESVTAGRSLREFLHTVNNAVLARDLTISLRTICPCTSLNVNNAVLFNNFFL